MYQFFMDEQRIRLLADEDGIDVAMFGTAMLFGITANARPKVSIKHDSSGECIEYVDTLYQCSKEEWAELAGDLLEGFLVCQGAEEGEA